MKRINIKKWVAVLLTLATVIAAMVQIGCGGNKPQESSPETTPSPTPMESTPVVTPNTTPDATPNASDSTPSASVTAPPWYSSGASTESGGDPFQGEWDPIN